MSNSKYVVTCNKCGKIITHIFDCTEEEIQEKFENIQNETQGILHHDSSGLECDGELVYGDANQIMQTQTVQNEIDKNLEVARLVKTMPLDMTKEQYLGYVHKVSSLLIDIYKIKTIKANALKLEEMWTWEGYYNTKGESTIHSVVLQKDSRMTKIDYNAIIEYIKAQTRVDRNSIITKSDCTNILNGVLDFSSGKVRFIERHDTSDFSEYNFINIVPIVYDPKATCPIIDKILEDVLKDDNKINLILELTASLFVNDSRFKKAFVLAGKPNTGKTTILNIFINLLTERNICSVSIHQLDVTKNRFAGADLDGVIANIVDEMPNITPKNIEIFKNATGGAGFRVEKKGKDGYTIKPFAKHIFAANELPEIGQEISESFFSRIIMIVFENIFEAQIGEDIKNYKDMKFSKSEMSGFLNRIIPALERILKNKEFSYDDDPEEAWTKYRELENPLSSFIYECTFQDTEGGWIRKEFFYHYYLLYCINKGIHPFNINRFGRYMKKMFGITDTYRPSVDDKQFYAWSGIRLKDNFLAPYFHSKYSNFELIKDDVVTISHKCGNSECGNPKELCGKFSRVDNAYGIVKCDKCGNDTLSITNINWKGSNYTFGKFEELRRNKGNVEWKSKLMTFDKFEDYSNGNSAILNILVRIAVDLKNEKYLCPKCGNEINYMDKVCKRCKERVGWSENLELVSHEIQKMEEKQHQTGFDENGNSVRGGKVYD